MCLFWAAALAATAKAAVFELTHDAGTERIETLERGGVRLLPLTRLLRPLELSAAWQSAAGTVRLEGRNGGAVLAPGSRRVLFEGLLVPLTSAPLLERGELYVPPDFVPRVAALLLGRRISLQALRATVLAAAAPELRPPDEPLVPRPVLTVVLDPGHGGKDNGATGKTGLAEKHVALQICRLVQRRLELEASVRVVLTRTEDVFLELAARTAVANERGDCFVSVHLNSGPREGANGFEVYSMSPRASDKAALAVSRFENQQATAVELPEDLEPLLWDMAQNNYLNESAFFAETLVSALSENLAEENRGAKQAPFLVLAGATVPAILVEVAFITNEQQEAALRTEAYRERIAEAVASGILAYLEHYRGKYEMADEHGR
jgi:N-acetylmuramoyl-L-alanine amidase